MARFTEIKLQPKPSAYYPMGSNVFDYFEHLSAEITKQQEIIVELHLYNFLKFLKETRDYDCDSFETVEAYVEWLKQGDCDG